MEKVIITAAWLIGIVVIAGAFIGEGSWVSVVFVLLGWFVGVPYLIKKIRDKERPAKLNQDVFMATGQSALLKKQQELDAQKPGVEMKLQQEIDKKIFEAIDGFKPTLVFHSPNSAAAVAVDETSRKIVFKDKMGLLYESLYREIVSVELKVIEPVFHERTGALAVEASNVLRVEVTDTGKPCHYIDFGGAGGDAAREWRDRITEAINESTNPV